MARLCLVGRDAPGPAAGDWAEPHVVFGDEGDEFVADVREREVTGCSHRLILGGPKGRPAATGAGPTRPAAACIGRLPPRPRSFAGPNGRRKMTIQ